MMKERLEKARIEMMKERLEKARMREAKRKEEGTKEMIDRIGVKRKSVLHICISAETLIETTKGYTAIYVSKYPTGLYDYRIVHYKKEYPFNVIREQRYYKPLKKYSKIIEELKEMI